MILDCFDRGLTWFSHRIVSEQAYFGPNYRFWKILELLGATHLVKTCNFHSLVNSKKLMNFFLISLWVPKESAHNWIYEEDAQRDVCIERWKVLQTIKREIANSEIPSHESRGCVQTSLFNFNSGLHPSSYLFFSLEWTPSKLLLHMFSCFWTITNNNGSCSSEQNLKQRKTLERCVRAMREISRFHFSLKSFRYLWWYSAVQTVSRFSRESCRKRRREVTFCVLR